MVDSNNLLLPNIWKDGRVDKLMKYEKCASNWEHVTKNSVLRHKPSTNGNNVEDDDDSDNDEKED